MNEGRGPHIGRLDSLFNGVIFFLHYNIVYKY